MTQSVGMRAMVTMGHGGLDQLVFHNDWPKPQAGLGQALIRVAACGMNNTDINTRIGWYSSKVTEGTTAEGGEKGFATVDESGDDGSWGRLGVAFPRIQGADVCGTVEAVGTGGDPALIGKRVLIDTWLRDWDDPLNIEKCQYFGSECDGGYAEYAVAPIANVHPIESDLADVELATFATAYVTAENMLVRANVGKGDRVLIPGASGGVGSALVQLVRHRGALPIAMCSASKAEEVKSIGAEAVLDRSSEDLVEALRSAIGEEQVDVVADVVGGPVWPRLIAVLKRRGRYTCSGAIAGPIVDFDLRTFYLNDLTFTGATVIPPNLFADLVGIIARGEVRPLVAATYPLEELRLAQEAFLSKRHTGKIVVTI